MSEDPLFAQRVELAEEFGRFFDENGLPGLEGRILGWLVVCDPPQQSADDLVAALGGSRGGVSMAMKMLIRTDAVERVSQRGTRRYLYCLRPGLWRREIERRMNEAIRTRDLAIDGLKRMSSAPHDQLTRLQDMREMYEFLVDGYQELYDRWRAHAEEEQHGFSDGH